MTDRFSPLGIIPGMKEQKERAVDPFALPKGEAVTPRAPAQEAAPKQPLMGPTGVTPPPTAAGTMLDQYSSWIQSGQRKDALDREYMNMYS